MTPDRRPRVLFYVQHLFGIGHAFRATRVARAMAAAGFRVHMVWGGTRLPAIDFTGIDVVWMEPVRAASSDFAALVTASGKPVDEAMLARRRDRLLAVFHDLRPDIVITETFPFGRRQMQFELVPFAAAAAAASWRPMMVSSIRDIMTENRKEARARESVEWAVQWYDLVLVHGDPSLVPIEATLQHAGEIADKFRYTGIVAPDPVDISIPPTITADVVVSAGGGAFGHALTAATLRASAHSARFPRNWLLVVGSERSEEDFRELRAAAGTGLRVERHVPDLARILAAARVSVSRAGYNTVGDVLRAGCRTVLVPYEGGRETEQARRAELMAENGLAITIRDTELDAGTLGAAVDMAADLKPVQANFDLEGAANSTRIVAAEYARRRNADRDFPV